MSDEGMSPLVLLGAAAAALFLLLAAILGAFSGTAQPSGAGLGRVALWLPLVTREATAAGLPPALVLGLIAQESGGDYQAVNNDPNGTVDAGLGQLNSGQLPSDPQWAALGLLPNPFDPTKNVAATVHLLAIDTATTGSVDDALYAYNGGTAANGRRYEPAYAPDVLRQVQGLESGPLLAVWPVGGTLQHGVWLAPPSAGNGEAFFLVAAMGPIGQPVPWDGMQWATLVPPATISATVNGGTVALQPSSAAPQALLAITPPAASFWWFTAPVGGTVSVSVQAQWPNAGSPTDAVNATGSITAREG